MRTRKTYAAATLGAAVLLGSAVAAVPAYAGGGGGGGAIVQRTGACSMGSTWIAKSKPVANGIELEFSVETLRAGQAWSVRVTDNRQLLFSGNRTTNKRSRSLSVNRLTADRAGADHFRARAVNAKTGEVCRGHVALTG
jgi:hypothetical protein